MTVAEDTVECRPAATRAAGRPVAVKARLDAARLKAAYLLAGATDWFSPEPSHGRGRLLAETLHWHTSGLDTSAVAITGYMKRLDLRFRGFGDDMTELTAASHELVEQCTALLEMSIGSGDTSHLAQRALALLEEPLRFLTDQGEAMTVLERQMDDCRGTIHAILGADARLSEAVAPLRYIRTMFRTESARLDEGVQAMFSALTEQMRELQERVEGAFESNYSSLRETEATLVRVSRTMRERAQLLSEGGAASGLSVARSREALIDSLRRNEGKTVELTEVARGIESFVQSMVVSMQVHDIVNQKLDHVREAIARLRGMAGGLPRTATREVAPLLVTLHQLARVQEAQLHGAAADLRHSAEEFGSACSQVVNKIEELDQRCLQLKEFDEITASADGMIEVLVHSIGEVRRLAAEERVVTTEILGRVKWMGEQAAPLGRGMVEVAEQMRRIAVNTQVYAIQMGNGTGLEALAAESVQVAARVAEVSSDVVAALGKLNSLLLDLTGALQTRHDAAEGIESTMNGEGSDLEASLHAMRDRMISLLLEIGGSMERARGIGSRVHSHVEAEDQSTGGIADALGAVQAFEATCAWLIQQLGLEEVAAEGTLPQEQYTMQSEREIHAQVAGKTGKPEAGSESPSAPAAQPAGAMPPPRHDDLGDNVELF